MTHVIIEVSPGPSLAVRDPAADLMTCGPHHLGVMSDIFQVVAWIAVCKVLVLEEPRFDSEEPVKFYKILNIFGTVIAD